MKCALAALGFINEDLQHNKKVILDTMRACSGKVDLVLFGEAFLQGFYGVTFDVEHDSGIAISLDDKILREISAAAKHYAVAVSFGFIEKKEECFYSSQITIDTAGNVVDLYRRRSPGWKEPFAGDKYCEGDRFHSFFFRGKKIAVGLCGDLWYEESIDQLRKLNPEVVFWPVYTDFIFREWNDSIKYEYAEQAKQFCDMVLYVNSVCLDREGEEYAKGGAALFWNGIIHQEVPAGSEEILIVEL